jgi:hypothetical protein
MFLIYVPLAILKYTNATVPYNPLLNYSIATSLPFDAHRRFHFLTQKAAADLDKSLGSIGDKETVHGVTFFLVSTPFLSSDSTSFAVSSAESTNRTTLPMNCELLS